MTRQVTKAAATSNSNLIKQMKLALFLTMFTLAGSAFAGPAANIVFDNKGRVISVKRIAPEAMAPASSMASCVSKACCAKHK